MTPEAIALIVMAAITGLAVGALAMYFVMDPLVRAERDARDRAVDLMTRMVARTPVSVVGVQDDANREKQMDELEARIKKENTEMFSDAIGEEDPNMDDLTAAGVEL